jgi:hypothetical protein
MADFMAWFYDGALEDFATGQLNWTGHDIKVMLCKATYAASRTADNYLSVISAGDRVAISGNLTGKTVTDGILDATDVVIPAGDFLNSGPATQLVFYRDTGVEATSRLIFRAGPNSYDGLFGAGYTHTGLDLKIKFPDDAYKIAKLGVN